MSESAKTAIIILGIAAGIGAIAFVVYVILSKLQIINKKIDPRKIRIFTIM